MVLEDIKAEFIERRPYVTFALGFAYTFIGYGISMYFFGKAISIAMLFLATLLLVPTLIHLLDDEERRERESGITSFFRNHRDIAEAYIFLFLGIFIGYLVLGFLVPSQYGTVFQFQTDYLTRQQGLTPETIQSFLDGSFQPSLSAVLGVMAKNLPVALLFFVLSIFYGAGAIFLIVLNASVFSSFVHYVVQQLAQRTADTLTIVGFFSVHLLPEITGFLLAAIAGGVVSKAVLNEKFGSKGFSNVMKDSIVLLLISFGFIILGAIAEVYLTTSLFKAYF